MPKSKPAIDTSKEERDIGNFYYKKTENRKLGEILYIYIYIYIVFYFMCSDINNKYLGLGVNSLIKTVLFPLLLFMVYFKGSGVVWCGVYIY